MTPAALLRKVQDYLLEHDHEFPNENPTCAGCRLQEEIAVELGRHPPAAQGNVSGTTMVSILASPAEIAEHEKVIAESKAILTAAGKKAAAPAEQGATKAAPQLSQEELHSALFDLTWRIEVCGASVELTNAVTLCSDIRSAIGNQWNPADKYAAQRVLSRKELTMPKGKRDTDGLQSESHGTSRSPDTNNRQTLAAPDQKAQGAEDDAMMICPMTQRTCELTGCFDKCLVQPTALPPHQLGWLCPKCGRGNAPTTPTCPCVPWDVTLGAK